jgi:hypothetical protein
MDLKSNWRKESDGMGKIVISEVSQKQAYIFRTNKQKENIGASYIIKAVTEDIQKEFAIKNHGEIIYAGGGKSLYYFEMEKDAEIFAKEYSLHIIKEFIGVELFIASQDYNPKIDRATEKVAEAYRLLGVKKAAKATSIRQVGFGIAQNNYILESDLKERYAKEGKRIGSELLYGSLESTTFPNIVDDLVDNDEKSYIAVVHIDGNSMGTRFMNLRQKYEEQYNQGSLDMEKINMEYLDKCNQFSDEMKKIYQTVYREMLEEIKKNMDADSQFPYRKENKLPIIPLIIAGDDITFLCAGKIALECIRIFLSKLESKQSSIDGEYFYACGGAVLIRKHYPFFTAYELAEKLCANAKAKIRQYDNKKSAMDWHIVQGECDNLKEMREKLYSIDNSKDKLLMRPLIVTGTPTKEIWEHYQNFTEAMKIILNGGTARSKIRQLRNALRRGRVYTENYIRVNKLGGTFITLDQNGRINRLKNADAIGTGQAGDIQEYLGFYQNTCLYFDALEMMDLFYQFN